MENSTPEPLPKNLAIGIFLQDVDGKPQAELKVHKGIQPIHAIKLLQETALSLMNQVEAEMLKGSKNRIVKPNFAQNLRANMDGNGRIK